MKHIQLKTKDNKTYFLSGITEEQKELILKARELKDFSIFKHDTIIAKNIVKLGEKSKAKGSNLTHFVDYLKGYEPNLKAMNNNFRKVQFREYGRTEEKQLETSHLISLCEDANSSGRSAIKAINGQYIILWYKENL